ncbi:ABC transporter substrate-binding protein [Halomicrobium zhouii]|nr:ABC transporter substrate-binding protein [Halomicrobium zhouii]
MPRTTRREILKRVGATSGLGSVMIAGCSSDSDDAGGQQTTGGDTTDAGTAGSSGPDELHIGVFAPYTGPFAPWGSALTTGSELAKQDLEAEFDVSITLSEYDTETNPSAAQERIQRAVTSDGIDMAHGGISSAVCGSIGSWASDNGVPFITQGASDTLTGESCQPYMFRAYPSNTMMARAVGQPMAEEADSWYLLYTDYVWGQTAQEIIGSVLEENGATVAGTDAVPGPGNQDFTQYINNVENSDADGVAMIIPGLDARAAASQLQNRGLHEALSVMFHQFEDQVMWGLNQEAASMVDLGPTGWINTVEGGEDFKQRVDEQGETDPFSRQYMAYVSTDQAVRAAMRAGSANGDDVRAALEGHEITDSPVNDIVPNSTLKWRACDHQLVQPTHVVQARDASEMTNDPYKQWFEVSKTVAGDQVARSCEETGCSF